MDTMTTEIGDPGLHGNDMCEGKLSLPKTFYALLKKLGRRFTDTKSDPTDIDEGSGVDLFGSSTEIGAFSYTSYSHEDEKTNHRNRWKSLTNRRLFRKEKTKSKYIYPRKHNRVHAAPVSTTTAEETIRRQLFPSPHLDACALEVESESSHPGQLDGKEPRLSEDGDMKNTRETSQEDALQYTPETTSISCEFQTDTDATCVCDPKGSALRKGVRRARKVADAAKRIRQQIKTSMTPKSSREKSACSFYTSTPSSGLSDHHVFIEMTPTDTTFIQDRGHVTTLENCLLDTDVTFWRNEDLYPSDLESSEEF